MNEYELRTIYDSRKSFYGKAMVIHEGEKIKLKSYETIVCEIINNKPIVYGTYSHTTLRHIKEFLKQHGFKAETSHQILKDYSPSKEEEEQKEKEETEKTNSMFNCIKSVCALGDLLQETQKDKNDWKERMIKAGLGNKGLMFPDDWETLSEDDKEKRLNLVIEQLGDKKE